MQKAKRDFPCHPSVLRSESDPDVDHRVRTDLEMLRDTARAVATAIDRIHERLGKIERWIRDHDQGSLFTNTLPHSQSSDGSQTPH